VALLTTPPSKHSESRSPASLNRYTKHLHQALRCHQPKVNLVQLIVFSLEVQASDPPKATPPSGPTPKPNSRPYYRTQPNPGNKLAPQRHWQQKHCSKLPLSSTHLQHRKDSQTRFNRPPSWLKTLTQQQNVAWKRRTRRQAHKNTTFSAPYGRS
jgi:hypothetical protein